MREIPIKERIERLVREATELTFERCHTRDFDWWIYLHDSAERKMAQAKALRRGEPVPDDLPEFKGAV